jgi:hypothetical protein
MGHFPLQTLKPRCWHRHESFSVPHDRPGLLGMCCHAKDQMSSSKKTKKGYNIFSGPENLKKHDDKAP